MTKQKLLSIAVVILIALNLGVLGVFTFHKAPKDHPHGPSIKDHVVEVLDFTSAQEAAYEKLIQEHRQAIRKKEVALRDHKHALMALLVSEDEAKERDLLHELGIIHQEIESIHLAHFKSIKALCNKEQEEKFTVLSAELLHLFRPPHPPKRKH